MLVKYITVVYYFYTCILMILIIKPYIFGFLEYGKSIRFLVMRIEMDLMPNNSL